MSVIGNSAAPAETSCNCAAIRQAARRVTRYYDHMLAASGLRITQYPILVRLAGAGPATMHVLAEQLLLDRATLGHNLRPLEAQGLVAMATGTDRRSRVVAITEAGRQKLREARPAWTAAQVGFEAAFGTGDAVALRGLMAKVARLPLHATA